MQSRAVRLQAIKAQILSKLGMKRAPNVTRRALPGIPPLHRLLDRYDAGMMQADAPFEPGEQYDDDDDFHMAAEKIITFGQHVAQPRAAYLPTWPADASASQRNFFHQRRRRSAAATDGRRAEEKTRLSDAPASSSSLPWNAPIQQQCAVASCADISSSDGTRRAFSSAAPANIGGPACLYRFPLSRVARHIIEPRAAEPLLRALLRAARPGRRRHLHRLGLFDGKRASRPGQAARIQRTSLCNLIGCLHVDRLQRNTYTRARIVAYPRTLCMYVRWRKCARGSGCRIRKPAAVGHVKPVVSAVATATAAKET
ncbi:hypothetical protein HPB49_018556 [Dermacentor silvarum]|uniref:Uncharacterized protein n=1 Tax=Dermacentor silvarum TaxID=543639 RepID=A0ACB8DF93_DERSI|nr:hypothetical protein HPB49_018556 [Dermacentor silvarum]